MPLSENDTAVLQQVFDPESAPSTGLLVDKTLPKDPRLQDDVAFTSIVEQEKPILRRVEAALGLESSTEKRHSLTKAVEELKALLNEHTNVGSLHNDLAQALRLLHGDTVLSLSLIETSAASSTGMQALSALSSAVGLLSPTTPQAGASPTQCRTLAQAHMQRASLYRSAAKQLKTKPQGARAAWNEWTDLDFEEAASRDFFMAGRYGNEIGKAMAVHTNPTAKLCGQMVQDALRHELAQGS